MFDGSVALYRSTRWLARITVLLLGVGILVSIVSALARYGQNLLVAEIMAGVPFPEQSWTTSFYRARLIGYAGMGFYFATGLAFLGWVYQSYRNLPAFGVAGLQHSPGWVVGAWFVPVVNLFRPLQIVVEIHKASDPAGDRSTPYAWAAGRTSLLFSFWWGLWIGHTAFNGVVQRLLGEADTLGALVRLNRWHIAGDLVTALGAVLAMAVVLEITGRQEALWQRLQEWAEAPATADA